MNGRNLIPQFWQELTLVFGNNILKNIDYAEAKLNLMQALKLTEKEKIELLADGVNDFNLRRMVLNTWHTNVPDFIEHVRRITEDNVVVRKGESTRYSVKKSSNENNLAVEKTCFTCKRTWSSVKKLSSCQKDMF